jgi:predicted metal-dependent phosphoesterase TrpH
MKVLMAISLHTTDSRGFADLHMHTKFSDGDLSVDELIRLSKKKGLRCISITDHDNLDSYNAALEPAKEVGIEIIPGIEISSVYEGRDIHILGYFCDPTNLALNLELENFTRQRITRAKAIIKKLNTLGIDIQYEKVASFCNGKVIGRPHIAKTLVAEEYISSFAEAFTKYLGDGCVAFVEKKGLNPQQTIRLIENAGGIAVLAHPYKSGIEESFIPEFVEWGIQGIETYTPAQKGNIGKRYRDIAKRFNLVETGGSDFHAPHGTTLPNCMKMPYTAVTELKERKEKSRAEWF